MSSKGKEQDHTGQGLTGSGPGKQAGIPASPLVPRRPALAPAPSLAAIVWRKVGRLGSRGAGLMRWTAARYRHPLSLINTSYLVSRLSRASIGGWRPLSFIHPFGQTPAMRELPGWPEEPAFPAWETDVGDATADRPESSSTSTPAPPPARSDIKAGPPVARMKPLSTSGPPLASSRPPSELPKTGLHIGLVARHDRTAALTGGPGQGLPVSRSRDARAGDEKVAAGPDLTPGPGPVLDPGRTEIPRNVAPGPEGPSPRIADKPARWPGLTFREAFARIRETASGRETPPQRMEQRPGSPEKELPPVRNVDPGRIARRTIPAGKPGPAAGDTPKAPGPVRPFPGEKARPVIPEGGRTGRDNLPAAPDSHPAAVPGDEPTAGDQAPETPGARQAEAIPGRSEPYHSPPLDIRGETRPPGKPTVAQRPAADPEKPGAPKVNIKEGPPILRRKEGRGPSLDNIALKKLRRTQNMRLSSQTTGRPPAADAPGKAAAAFHAPGPPPGDRGGSRAGLAVSGPPESDTFEPAGIMMAAHRWEEEGQAGETVGPERGPGAAQESLHEMRVAPVPRYFAPPVRSLASGFESGPSAAPAPAVELPARRLDQRRVVAGASFENLVMRQAEAAFAENLSEAEVAFANSLPASAGSHEGLPRREVPVSRVQLSPAETAGQAAPAAPADTGQSSEASGGESSSQDLDELARDVYRIIKQKIARERERLPG